MSAQKREAGIFEKVVQILENLVRQGEVYISLNPPFNVTFEISRSVLLRELERAPLDEENFQRQSREISAMLLAIIADKENTYIDSVIEESEELEGKKADEIRAALKEQISKVKQSLFSRRLKDRYDLKRSSKTPVFSGIDWDIKVKTRDAHLRDVKLPYATCRIKFQREFEESPFIFFGGKPFDSVQVNFSVDDIDYLIKTLSIIKEYLAQAEE